MRALTPRETDFLPAAFDTPAVPQCHGAILQPAATGVLAWQEPDSGLLLSIRQAQSELPHVSPAELGAVVETRAGESGMP